MLEARAESGPLALCLHGFPDTAYTWRFLLPALADAGFHAVAPFMRGYAPSEVPADGCYSRAALLADAVALHEALGGDDQAVLIGHDWGAATTYGAAVFAPERWRRVVTLAIPPPALDARVFSDYDQLKRFFYMFLFQGPAAEELVAAEDFEFLARQWADWSPGYSGAAEDLARVRESLGRAGESIRGARLLPRADAGGRGWRERYASELAALGQTPPQPTLLLHGVDDGCISVELIADAGQHLSDGSRAVFVERAGHFLHLERPEEVGRLILDWVEG